MRICVIPAPGIPAEFGFAGNTCVVIDVLRATTSMIAALDAGAKAIYPVPGPEDAWRLRLQLGDDLLLGGERGGLKINGFDLGNSPREYTTERVGGMLLAMTTTNGTAAMLLAHESGAAPVYIAALRNAPAMARRLLREDSDTVIYCAGTGGRLSLDDIIAGGAIVSACQEAPVEVEISDTARLAMAAYRQSRKDISRALVETEHGSKLVELGFDLDIRFAAEIGASQSIGQFDGVMVRPAGHVLR